ncbi:MAG: excinuclease ABC subunit C [Bacteroidales bacterium]|nr:excinuclease ABC subunit C [Bacteroidales bacterium]
MKIEYKIKKIALLLPETPGVYQFYDKDDCLLYVGKAKNLKHRVSSYFTSKSSQNYKLDVLVKKIKRIDHIVVNNESDALLLENNLIKQNQPRYNILLKDDKTFPWICIKNERFPRVILTRKYVKDGSEYFGPYTSAAMVRTILSLIAQIYSLRTCTYDLNKENIEKGKYKVCLQYHLGNCKGPCEGLQDEISYSLTIKQIKELLKGNLQQVISYLKELMKQFAEAYKFEEAEKIRQKIDLLERFKSKSTIVNPKINDSDVFTLIEDDKSAYVNFIKVVNGAIVQTHSVELVKKLDETSEELLLFAITDLRERLNSKAREIIVPFQMDEKFDEFEFIVPKIGDKKKLLDLSLQNARFFKLEIEKRRVDYQNKLKENDVLEQLKMDLRLSQTPIHIECFDNSNIQGNHPVAACVVFVNGKPKKSEYRHFNVKTVSGPNDFASMEEIVFRRYSRMLSENASLPQLVIIDGGKGQLSSALKSLEKLNLNQKIAVIGIAKKLEEIYFPGDSIPLYINKNSKSLKLIQQIRNEAHRFGITFHRLKRSNSVKSGLENINGHWRKTIHTLLTHLARLINSKASKEELQKVIKKEKAADIWDYFNN